MTDRPVSLLRSVLFVPGNRPDRIGKAARSGADAVVLDLEDAVPAREKARARAVVADALAEVRGPLTCVRIQALETGLWKDDLNAIVGPGLDAVMLPKASPQSVVELAGRLSELEGERDLAGPVSILPLVETPGGIVDGAEIAAASPRVRTLVLGSGDLTRELDLLTIRWSRSGEELAYARAKLIVDARAAGCERPIDGPYLEVRDAEGFLADCERARVLGFQGKLCLHPDQVPVANQRFGPDPAEVEFCRRVIAAAEAAEAEGSAALTVDGVFVDIALARKARRIVAIAEALESASPETRKERAC